jgi:hypothetical protein
VEFPTPIITEITAPNTVPFQPGQNVIGFGSQVPPELQAAGITAAIVFYNSLWNTVSTTPLIKFHFIASFQGNIQVGHGYSLNPSTTPTATVVTHTVFTEFIGSGRVNNLLNMYNVNGATPQTRIIAAGEESNSGSGSSILQTFYNNGATLSSMAAVSPAFTDPIFLMADKAVTNFYQIRVNAVSKATEWLCQTPDGSSTWTRTVAQMIVDAWILRESAWTNVSFAAGVIAGGLGTPGYRKNADGTVMMRNSFGSSAVATNGMLLATLPAGYRPAVDCQFMGPCASRTLAQFQKIKISAATGQINLFDCSTALVVDFDVSAVRFPAI